MPHVRTRLAQLSDADDLAALEKICFPGNDMSPRQFRFNIRNPRARLMVAEDPAAGRIVGYCMVLHHARRGVRIYSLGVLPAWRGHGCARVLLQQSIRLARKDGARLLFLEVRQGHRRLAAFYRRLGFTVTKTLPDYYPDGGGALKMVLKF